MKKKAFDPSVEIEDFDSLVGLVTYFDTEDKCIAHFQCRRWGTTPTCPCCQETKVYKFSDNRRFKCSSCSKHFNVKTGTVFENSNIAFRKWFVAIYLLTSTKKGVSSYQLARDIKVSQVTAWFMLHRLRHALGLDNKLDEQLEGIVEVDETFVGGKNRNRHTDKKVKNSQGRSFKDKTPVLGMLQRNGKVKAVVVPNTSREVIEPIVLGTVIKGSTLYSDEWSAYSRMGSYYNHKMVDHGKRYYGDEVIHTNHIEGFWAWIKRMIMGVYHKTSKRLLQNYVHEAVFRYNTRVLKAGNRLSEVLRFCANTRLSYKQLING